MSDAFCQGEDRKAEHSGNSNLGGIVLESDNFEGKLKFEVKHPG
jgi:hypothetical protein